MAEPVRPYGLREPRAQPAWKEATRRIIFEADTTAGKAFDVALLVAILFSVVAVMLESVAGIRETYQRCLARSRSS